MRVALAASYSRKNEMRALGAELWRSGVDVVSRWMNEPDGDHGRKSQLTWGCMDLDDVDQCDYLVRFSDDLSEPLVPAHLATGGRFVEMGYALAKGKGVIVVGGHQTIYDHLLQVVHVPDFGALKRLLSPVEIN